MATAAEIIARYPILYHMAEGDSWSSIQRHGLLSTTALLDLFEVPERQAIESNWRQNSVRIEHPCHGFAVIRDQLPMRPEILEPCLDGGLTPCQWYRLLNGKCFFWASKGRLFRLLNAMAYRNRTHDVITVDTRNLLERYSARITLASFNTGAPSMERPRKQRGVNTFQSIRDYPLGNQHDEVVEIAVEYHVPDIAQFAMAVNRWMGNAFQHTVWMR